MAFPMDFPGRFAAMRHGEVIANLGESSQAKPMTWGGFNLKVGANNSHFTMVYGRYNYS
jgi:hypothetical protein